MARSDGRSFVGQSERSCTGRALGSQGIDQFAEHCRASCFAFGSPQNNPQRQRATGRTAVAFARSHRHGLQFGPSDGLAIMFLQRLQRLSAAVFSALRRGLDRCGDWLRARPRLAAWLYRPDAEYREFNGWYFAQFSEQEKMLADQPRMNFYHAAIARHVRPGDHVIDLGTGTGILAAFASRQGAAKVYAIDHSGILKHARRLAVHNRINNVEFVATHSRDFKPNERVDLILHEQMGDFLFDEAMVPNVIDLRERLLKPGGRILPSRFEFFCEPVKVKDDRHIPFIWELNVHGYDYSCLERSRPQETQYYQHASCDLGVLEHFLGEPAPALTLDLQTLQEADLPEEIHLSRTVENAGRLDGFAVYFRTLVDDDLVLSSSPLDPGRAPHWGFRILRTDAATFARGDVIEFTLTVEQWSKPNTWRWRAQKAPGPDSARVRHDGA
jgi:protein arginine N-methyltransferase 1